MVPMARTPVSGSGSHYVLQGWGLASGPQPLRSTPFWGSLSAKTSRREEQFLPTCYYCIYSSISCTDMYLCKVINNTSVQCCIYQLDCMYPCNYCLNCVCTVCMLSCLANIPVIHWQQESNSLLVLAYLVENLCDYENQQNLSMPFNPITSLPYSKWGNT